MSGFTLSLNQPLRVALLLLLLSMQSFVLAHELDHGALENGNTCATCSIGTGLDGATTVHHDNQLVVASYHFEPAPVPAAAVARLRSSCKPRAPPVSL